MSMKINNPEVFPIANNREVEVRIKFLHEGDDKLALLNAAEALKFYYEHGYWKSWATEIEVKS